MQNIGIHQKVGSVNGALLVKMHFTLSDPSNVLNMTQGSNRSLRRLDSYKNFTGILVYRTGCLAIHSHAIRSGIVVAG